MDGYIKPIMAAVVAFPFVAFFITLPYALMQYRKFERIPMMKVVIFYSFVFYMMAAYFLVILPLPSIESVAKSSSDGHVILQPLASLRGFIEKSNLNLDSKSQLLKILKSTAMLQLVFNIFLVLPFGVYLRYYFKRTWWQTLLLSFGLSLFFELTQLTGLYFIYPKPYRFFEVDDLICNTLGGMLGFLLAPLLHAFLPKRDDLDEQALRRSRTVSIVRQICATVFDWLIILFLQFAYSILFGGEPVVWYVYCLQSILMAMLYVILFCCFTGGYTPGKWFCRLRIVDASGEPARVWQHVLRNLLLYGVIYGAPFTATMLFYSMGDWPVELQYISAVFALWSLVIFLAFLCETVAKLFGGEKEYYYARLTRTRCVSFHASTGSVLPGSTRKKKPCRKRDAVVSSIKREQKKTAKSN